MARVRVTATGEVDVIKHVYYEGNQPFYVIRMHGRTWPECWPGNPIRVVTDS